MPPKIRPLRRRLSAIGVSLGIAWLALIPSQAEEARPNIVVIVADDLGYADLSCYGRKDYQTPALDRLAAEGVRFSHAYAAAPMCTPSRVAFMTGRYPARTAVGLWEPLTAGIDRQVGLTADQPTIASLLKASGYATALVGKWHLGSRPEHHPNRHGFDEFFGIMKGGADYASHVAPTGQPDLFHNAESVARDGYLTDLLTQHAVAFVSHSRTQPFFLSLQYTAPHWPWQAPGDPPYPTSANLAETTVSWQRGGSAKTFAAMMQRLDAGVGEILAALDQHGLRENTLVLFTSDNGGERFSEMGPFSGRKMQLREGGIRVPAFLRWPRVLTIARETEQPAITMDWTATILAAAGVQPQREFPLDGINLLPVCRGEKPVQPRTLAWRTFQRARQRALRHGDWKYLHDGERDYLFDVARDPAEKRDLQAEHPERCEELKKLLRAWETQMLEPVTLENQRPSQ